MELSPFIFPRLIPYINQKTIKFVFNSSLGFVIQFSIQTPANQFSDHQTKSTQYQKTDENTYTYSRWMAHKQLKQI